MTGKCTDTIETVFLTKTKKQIFVEGSVSLNRDKNGKVISTYGIWRNVTDRKKAEDDLKAAKANVEKQVEERTK